MFVFPNQPLPSKPIYSLPLCGCYILANQCFPFANYLALPLLKSTCEINIINALSEVTMRQQYHNITDHFLQIVYKLPVNQSICVHRFSATFAKKRIEGVVKQKQAAQKQYAEGTSQGKKVAYGQIDSNHKDTMILKIGNIGPQEKVVIQVSYIDQLELSMNAYYKFTLPRKMLPQYLQNISQTDFKQSFRKKILISDRQFLWDFKITLKSARKVTSFQSTTHTLTSKFVKDSSTQLQITLDKGQILNEDFVLLYSTQQFQLPSYTLGRTDIGSTVMVSFIPKFCSLNLDDAKQQALKSSHFETDIESAQGEYIFLLDRSGSMEGKRINKAKEALILFLKSLPVNSYFNVCSFGDNYSLLHKKSQKSTTQSISLAVKHIQKMTASLEGTQISKPLQKLLLSQTIEGYPKLIYLLTDGEVKNTQQVIDLVKKNVKYSRVHTIGIGDGASQSLIMGCAQKGKGQYIFIKDSETPAEKIIQLLNDSLSPVITQIELDYDKSIVQSIMPDPANLPVILKNQPANFYITFKGQLQSATSIALCYSDSKNKLPYKGQVEIDPESQNFPFIDVMGHRKQIQLLEEEEEFLFNKSESEKQKNKITNLSLQYKILSKYTSFICIEKQLADGKWQQVQSKGQLSVQIIRSAPPLNVMFENYRGYNFYNQPIFAPPSTRATYSPSYMLPFSFSQPDFSNKQLQGSFNPQPMSSIFSNQSTSNLFGSNYAAVPIFSAGQSSFGGEPWMAEMQHCQPSYLNKTFQPKNQPSFNQPQLFSRSLSKTQQSMKPASSGSSPASLGTPLFASSNLLKGLQFINQDEKQKKMKLIVQQQHFEGFWSNSSIITQLFGSQLTDTIKDRDNLAQITTFLVLKWINRHCPEKVYKLIAKKAANWLKKRPNALQIEKEFKIKIM